MNTSFLSPAVAVGDSFPPFELRSCRDRPVAIDPRSALIIFYRGHWCSHCRGQFADLARQHDSFRSLNFSIIAISADDFVGANDMTVDTGGAIDFLSDPSAAFIEQLGLVDRDDSVDHVIARPAVFIIDADGIVRYRYISRSPADRPTSALLLLAIESLAHPARKESTTR
ncbi:MAG TPA: redoxin domain-containing protein [Thermomicrobiales bacterium]|nr:redoxin domain-containing protein [Thermomicrobiales bacterium]